MLICAFYSIILIYCFLLFMFGLIFISLFLSLSYTSIILILFLVNGLVTMLSLSFTCSTYFNFRLFMNYSSILIFSSFFVYIYFFNLITYFSSLCFMYLCFSNLFNNKMNAIGILIYSTSIFLLFLLMFLSSLINISLAYSLEL